VLCRTAGRPLRSNADRSDFHYDTSHFQTPQARPKSRSSCNLGICPCGLDFLQTCDRLVTVRAIGWGSWSCLAGSLDNRPRLPITPNLIPTHVHKSILKLNISCKFAEPSGRIYRDSAKGGVGVFPCCCGPAIGSLPPLSFGYSYSPSCS
jgi:hypothetical protein